MTTDQSQFLTEYQWETPIYPIRCFTCQREVQTCGTRYTCMILKFLFEPGFALNCHELLCVKCWSVLYNVMKHELENCPIELKTEAPLKGHLLKVYHKFSLECKCPLKQRKRQLKLPRCCRRMIFTNVDLSDEHNNYKQWIYQIPSVDEHSITRRSIKLTDDEAHKAIVARGMGGVFNSKRELSVGQLQLSAGSVPHIDRCNPLPKFRCLNFHLIWKNKLCLGWVMRLSIKRNWKTKKKHYLWTVRGKFCSPGCAFIFAWEHPTYFPR
jgi:DNA-directed RNA polymerase subunit N (RpoN/RPB10)